MCFKEYHQESKRKALTKIFANFISANILSHKELISRIYKELKLNHKKTNNPSLNGQKDLNIHFSKAYIQLFSKPMESTFPLIVKENANQNCNDITLHTHYNGYNKKDKQ